MIQILTYIGNVCTGIGIGVLVHYLVFIPVANRVIPEETANG